MMEPSFAKVLLNSLVQRVEQDATGKLRINGIITTHEYEALQAALEALTRSAGSVQASSTQTSDPCPVVRLVTHEARPAQGTTALSDSGEARTPIAALVKDPARLGDPEPTATLCIDFGTAKSKAYATTVDDGGVVREIPLALGSAGGESGYPLTSAVWIDESGAMFFGMEAVNRHIDRRDGTRRRIESLKQELSQGSRESLRSSLSPAENPTPVRLTRGDVLTAYLAFLTDAAESALVNAGLSRLVRRRYAIPAWDDAKVKEVVPVMQDLLARAQVIADSARGRWNNGFSAAELRSLIDELDGDPVFRPVSLVGDPVLEPIAAGNSRLRRDKQWKGLALVVDVGAGTSDFAVFVGQENPDEDAFQFFPLANARGAIRQAGDTVDDLLIQHILRKEGVAPQDAAADRLTAGLRKQIRALKETLFEEHEVRYELTDDRIGVAYRDEFLAEPGVASFKNRIIGYADELVERLSRDEIAKYSVAGIQVVLTGGGANLPFLNDLTNRETLPHGISIRWRPTDLIPQNVKGRDIEDDYLQLAVAIGGAQPVLPDVKRAVSSVKTQLAPTVRAQLDHWTRR
jgi:hypothetical protein